MKRIVILGAGESGAGAAVLAKKEGFDVFVSDMSAIKDKYKKMLDDRGIEWEEGQHTEEKILNADEIIKSPGIPKEAPMVQKLIAQGTHIISEIEFAGRYTNSKMICITGSNGKTTTTSLIYHIFKDAGYDAGLAGNIGNSLALQVAEDPHEYYIIELSSFQLDNMYDFRANIAILLNITPDHLDRYDYKFENYADAKMRIIQNQTKEDSFIYWNDDPVIKKELEKFASQPIRINVEEVKKPKLSAKLVAENIGFQLGKRMNFRRAVKMATQSTMTAGAKGVRVEVSGRLNGAEMSRREKFIEGSVPLHTLRADIDFYCHHAPTIAGIVGVKVWIYKGEK